MNKFDFSIIRDAQTPKVPLASLESLLKEKEELEAFLEFASDQYTAVGLAANQCSMNGERFMFPVFAKRIDRTRDWRLIILPKMVSHKGMVRKKIEGCLTWSDQKVLADRHHEVTIQYFDIEGGAHEETVQGFEAQIWQHEINHLLGVEEDLKPKAFILQEKKIMRNDKCPCGSGVKYKNCCTE